MKKLLQSLFVFMLFAISAMAQQRTITGTVTGKEDGLPLPGVSVKIKGTRSGTTTGSDGKYSISVPEATTTLEFTYLGYISQSAAIGGGNSINIALVSESKGLSEVVVVGYQSVKKSDLTSAVSIISGKEVADKPIASFTQLLQGKAAGVQVTAQSGKPGANAFIRMRGTGSLKASSEPLIILDGIAISTTSYNMLNPNDIETINFLKDASATAIYGSRGSNGVVVISTKTGKGSPVLSYSFSYGVANAQKLKNLTLMNAQQKLQYEYEGDYTNPTLDSMIITRSKNGSLPAGSTLFSITPAQRQALWDLAASRGQGDWSKAMLRDNAVTKKHEVSLSGSSDKITYYFSLNKSDNDGVEQESYFNKTGGRLNVEYQAKDWFKLGTNIGVTQSKDNTNRELFNGQALYTAALLLNPYEPLYLPNGAYNYTSLGQNALETAINNPNVSNRIGSFATLYGEAKAFNHLTLRSQLGMNYNTLNQEYYLKPGSYLAQTLGYNQKRDNGNTDFLYVFTNTANWVQTFGGKHTISALVGTEFTKDKFYSFSLTARGFPSSTVNTLENGATPTQATTSRSDYAMISYFASAQYDYDKRYFLSGSLRTDGSSRFGANKRFATFWSVGGAWDIKNESFFHVDEISNLKLRGSVGTSGNNTGIGNYDALGTYAYNVSYNGQPAASPAQIANPDLTWEQNNNWDLGLDFGLLNNRISGSFDYYNRKTANLLYPVNLSLTTGFSTFSGNIGSIKNKGVELSLTGDVIRNKDITWTLYGNYTHNDNKVTGLYNNNVAGDGTNGLGYLDIGRPAFNYFLVQWAGVNPQTGKNEWYDNDGNKTDVWSSKYAKLLDGKSPQIKYYGSFGTTFRYKEFDLGAQFYYSGGNYIYNIMWNVGSSEGESINNQQFTDALNYWKKPGDVVRYANLKDEEQRVTYDSDKYLEKGDYISLRDITLGYTLKQSILQKIHVKGLRVYVQATNLWLGTKFHGNPEVGQSNAEQTSAATQLTVPGFATLYSYPQIKAVTFGVNVKF
ncbi:hypothetical protein DBR11_11275 [Pedobacter sp. HMWF019]|uniref:SusC/RagA family TonB-linked outer membrane protein n=1 Tax=Pedobacter sp. HMWF019 TaxID=2056856 RepID=UPI000D3A4709|nr:TonB-dependent receptor [Pedobacter sp. HMWF019]PTS99950.1 hypothetical protein DBR11_11275 [Pedobacter sp. HMWF019]